MGLNATLHCVSRAAARGLPRAALLVSILAAAPQAESQSRIACGSFYRVAPGDSIEQIAVRAYGTHNYWEIFDANRNVLPDVWQIEVGTDLFIPCRDGAGPKTRREALAAGIAPAGPAQAAAAEATVAAVRPDDGGIGFLTGSDFAPFAHEALPEGGMIAELVRLAIANAAPGRRVDISFVNDWPAHLRLLDQGAYDLGFPWYRPDCERADRLTAAMQARCAMLDFSEPLFEVAIGYYTRAGDPLVEATDYRQLFGRRICRPAGYFTFDLDQEDLRAPNVTRVIAPKAEDCFAGLTRGEIDVVSLNEAIARSEITRIGLVGHVAEIPALRSSQTLHVVAKKGDRQGRAYLDMINSGLAELKSSGRWFEVVSRHLGAFGMSVR
jgi:polar amino acid transport system substrate-binding protein